MYATTLFAGTITLSVSSLYNFGNVYPYHSSTSQRYTVSGTSLSTNLIITADNGFEISTTYGHGYSKTITLTPVSGTIASTTVFVRFSPSATGAASGNIVNSSVGSVSQNVAVTATCINWSIPTSPSNYYSTATGYGAALKTNLYNKILGHTDIPYGSGTSCTNCVWGAFQTTDVQPNGKVWDIYSTRFDQASPYEYVMRTDQCGTYSIEGDCYNREHSFPKSWFNDATPMHDDLFHLIASDGKVNGMRSNYPYGTVSAPTFTSLYGGKLGPNTYPGYTGTVFEPIDEYKGDFARGYLYMATRYQNLIGGWVGSAYGNSDDVLAGNSFPAYDAWHVNLLMDWHNLDPVSDKEIKRNNAIYALQNNRNPFIDSPHFAQRIWGGTIPAEPSISASNLSISNLSNTSVTLSWKSGNGNRRIVLVKALTAVNAFPTDTFQYNANSNINLAPQIGTGNYVVYNGTGSYVTLTNLVQGTTYHYAIIEYNGWYTSSNYQTSGYLTSSATTLPVELLSFTATSRNKKEVLLQWATASEQNNNFFTIERSVDTKQWEDIGQVKGAGNSLKTKTYQYIDDLLTYQPINSATFYYRLRQTDFDGTTSHSNMVSVGFETDELVVSEIMPNPFNQDLRISFQTAPKGEIHYSIKNLIGETYVEEKTNLQNGTYLQIDNAGMGQLAAGVYVLQLEYAGKQYHHKIIKQ